MALFNKQYLNSVVLIENQISEGSYQTIATGVMIGFPINIEEQDLTKRLYRIFLLTNRHVFSGQRVLWLRFDKKDELNYARFPIELSLENQNLWLAHTDDKVDLAMIAVNIQPLVDGKIDFGFINEEMFAYPENFSQIGIELGDEIFFAGFPMGISGNLKNYAIIRSGSIARVDKEIIEFIRSFLIDANVFPGNSGGPVFLKPELASLEGTIAVNRIYLLGIVSGYEPYREPLYSHQSNPPVIAGYTNENSGLATVVPMNFARDIYKSFLNQQEKMQSAVKGEDKIVVIEDIAQVSIK